MTLEDLRTQVGADERRSGQGELRRHAIRPKPSAPTISFSPAPTIALWSSPINNGAPVALSDVANVVDATEDVREAAWWNEKPAVIVNIQRQPGANIIDVVDRIEQLLPQLKLSLPSG